MSRLFNLLIYLLCSSLFFLEPVEAFNAKEIYKNVTNSVIVVKSFNSENRIEGLGSGFFIRPNIVVTNYHVLENASHVTIKLTTGKEAAIKFIAGIDVDHDLVLLRSPLKGRPLELSDRIPEVGEKIFAIGNPKGLECTLSDGIISGVRKRSGSIFYQITAPISPGSSGGPIVDEHSKVIGVATFYVKGGQNLNFAVPAMHVAKLISIGKISTLPLQKKYSTKTNPEVQLQDNGWIKIVNNFVGECSDETLRNAGFRQLYIKIEFLKPCNATRLKFDISKKTINNKKLSPKEHAFLLLKLNLVSPKTKEGNDKFYKEYEDYCKENGIDPIEFLNNVFVPKFRCSYRIKVFVTFYTKEGHELKTDSIIPWAMLIDSSSNKRKTEMLPRERTFISFLIPPDAMSWDVWVPK